MRRRARWGTAIFLVLLLVGPGLIMAQEMGYLTRRLIKSYDLLQEGKLDQAEKIYQEILQKYPDQPLALNNLAALLVKKKDYEKALILLEKAWPKAEGYQVLVNQVCDVEGICLAFRPLDAVYGNQDLQPLIKLNLDLVRAKLQAQKEAK
ncbi:MAG: tetratricopeptide repeat protein [Thermodesulfobacteriota bacterium]